jgi:PAS domain S-box-containing protein
MNDDLTYEELKNRNKELEQKIFLYEAIIDKHTKTEDALNQATQRLLFHVENSPLGVIEWDTNFVVTRWTGEAETMFGWSAEETVGKPITDLQMIYEADIKIVENTMKKLSDGLSKNVVSYNRNYTKNRQVIHCEWYNTVLYDNNCKMVSVMSQVLDLTDRIKAEEMLKESELLLNETGRIAKVGGWKINLKTQQLIWTKEIYHIHEVSDNYQPKVKEAINFYEENSKTIIQKALEDAIQYGKPFEEELEIITAKGNKLHVRALGSVQMDITGKTEIVFGTFQDITKQKLTIQALKDSELKLKEAQQIAQLGNWELDIVKNELFWSEEIYRIFDCEPNKFKASYEAFIEFIHPDDREAVNFAYTNSLKTRTAYEIEHRIITKNNTVKYVKEKCNSEFDNSGNPLKSVGIVIDITELKKTELELEQYAKELKQLNIDKDRFITILAHDLKSPFNSLIGLSDLLINNIYNYDLNKIEKFVNHINKSARNTYNLLEEILTWARVQAGKISFEPVNLRFNDICEQIIESLKPLAIDKNLTINHFAEYEIEIFADKNMLSTILRNLIFNAIKFTNSGGQINIYAEKNHSDITITVSDNGIGITQQELIKLFDITKIYSINGTSNESGTGLGLLLCKEFVDKHNGKIWVESEFGKGSEFKFTLPTHDVSDNNNQNNNNLM